MSAADRSDASTRLGVSLLTSAVVAIVAMASLRPAVAAAAPAIRASIDNPVPACVTPDRLMAFLSARNSRLVPRFANIAKLYKHWGEAWRVRWDYAFFQMTIETNYLSYRRADGRRGDVHEAQNNFAGIGATGGGVPGDRFADVSTGVHAQIQHLVVYSGERLQRPLAPRTTLKQDVIVEQSLRLNRPVTFGDLARRWAADRHYARSIEFVANQYREIYCREDARAAAGIAPPPAPQPVPRIHPPPSGLGGPKPSALAGPQPPPDVSESAEALPWAAAPTADENAVNAPAAVAVSEKSPVRTIWTRPPDTSNAKPSTIATTGATPDEASAQTAETARAPEAPADNGIFTMPLFRIAPAAPPPPSRLGGPLPKLDATGAIAEPSPCRVLTASYGGNKTLLVRSKIDGQLRLTALTLLEGFEKTLFETYARAAAPGAEIVGEYQTPDDALADAHANCPAD